MTNVHVKRNQCSLLKYFDFDNSFDIFYAGETWLKDCDSSITSACNKKVVGMPFH